MSPFVHHAVGLVNVPGRVRSTKPRSDDYMVVDTTWRLKPRAVPGLVSGSSRFREVYSTGSGNQENPTWACCLSSWSRLITSRDHNTQFAGRDVLEEAPRAVSPERFPQQLKD